MFNVLVNYITFFLEYMFPFSHLRPCQHIRPYRAEVRMNAFLVQCVSLFHFISFYWFHFLWIYCLDVRVVGCQQFYLFPFFSLYFLFLISYFLVLFFIFIWIRVFFGCRDVERFKVDCGRDQSQIRPAQSLIGGISSPLRLRMTLDAS